MIGEVGAYVELKINATSESRLEIVVPEAGELALRGERRWFLMKKMIHEWRTHAVIAAFQPVGIGLLALCGLLVSCAHFTDDEIGSSEHAKLHVNLPEPDVAYIWVYDGPGDDARPLFEMLLPEVIQSDGVDVIPVEERPVRSYFHMQPSKWEELGDGRWLMLQTHPGYVTYEIALTPAADALHLEWRIRNDTGEPWKELTGLFCTGAGWGSYTGAHGWYNPDFQPAPPLPVAEDPREAEREFRMSMINRWRDELVKENVWVHTPDGWRRYPDAATDMDVPLIACRSLDGQKLLALAWDTPARASHGGHLCIHLVPMVAGELPPGEWASSHGAAYVLEGSLDDLLERYRKDFGE